MRAASIGDYRMSTLSVCSLAEVARASLSPPWFQLYMIRDRAFMMALLEEAERSGCTTLVFTVDMPVPGSRYGDYRSGLAASIDSTESMLSP